MTSFDDLTLERKSKNRKLIGLLAQRVETEIRFLDMAGACRTLEKNKGVEREVREKEPILIFDKPKPSPIITLLKAVNGA